MGKYLFTLRDYHAVKDANIRIGGITVLAGLNGSGKSSIARWVNNMVNVLNNYDKYVISEAKEEFEDLADTISRASHITPFTRLEWNRIDRGIQMADDLEGMKAYIEDMVLKMTDLFQRKLSPEQFEKNYGRLCGAYNLERLEHESLPDFLIRFSDKVLSESNAIYESSLSKLKNHSLRNLRSVTEDVIDVSIDSWPDFIQFSEEGMDLLTEEQFLEPITLRQSFYLETQNISLVVTPNNTNRLSYFLQNPASSKQKEAAVLSKMIKNVIGGEVVLEKNATGKIYKPDEFHFIRKDGLNILLKGAATGIISFSYILRLLENGWITKETLLIIDEPEAHMHPQWIVEYARILVLIKRFIGSSILISTHSPDMVAAIRSISEREGLLKEIVFYAAEKDEDSGKYIYRDLDHEIGPIFDSFNIATDRIDMYGVKDKDN